MEVRGQHHHRDITEVRGQPPPLDIMEVREPQHRQDITEARGQPPPLDITEAKDSSPPLQVQNSALFR